VTKNEAIIEKSEIIGDTKEEKIEKDDKIGMLLNIKCNLK